MVDSRVSFWNEPSRPRRLATLDPAARMMFWAERKFFCFRSLVCPLPSDEINPMPLLPRLPGVCYIHLMVVVSGYGVVLVVVGASRNLARG